MMRSQGIFRLTLVACAAQWNVVGLELASLLRGVEGGGSARAVSIVLLIAFAVSGLSSLALLWLWAPHSLSAGPRAPAT